MEQESRAHRPFVAVTVPGEVERNIFLPGSLVLFVIMIKIVDNSQKIQEKGKQP
jgi:hypothetical protein